MIQSLGDLKGEETIHSPEDIKVANVSLGLRTELVLYVEIMFVQGLLFLICIATPLGLYACIFLANGRGGSSVKQAIAALLKALRDRNFIPISLLSITALCTDTMRSLGVRFNPAGLDQHMPTVERSSRTVMSKVKRVPEYSAL